MYAMHDALRRELEQLAKVTARMDDDPRRILRAASGWALFKKALHLHHTTEDDVLWPAVRANLTGRADDLALLDAMEAEHAVIDPVIERIDAALADTGGGPGRLGDLTDDLTTKLRAHLAHEEDEALPLIQRAATEEQWRAFGQAHAARVGPDAARIVPWMLDGANPRSAEAMLAQLPEPLRAAYRDQWLPAYAAEDRWGA